MVRKLITGNRHGQCKFLGYLNAVERHFNSTDGCMLVQRDATRIELPTAVHLSSLIINII